MFDGQNHTHALTTAFGALGGFAAAPKWWTDASQSSIVQLLALTVLVYQGGGNLNWTYSLAVAVLFTVVMNASGYLSIDAAPVVSEEEPPAEEEAATEAAAPPAEFYYNY